MLINIQLLMTLNQGLLYSVILLFHHCLELTGALVVETHKTLPCWAVTIIPRTFI